MICGIDIGGTNTAIGIVNIKGNILCETSIKTAEYATVNLFVENIALWIQNYCTTSSEPLEGIGIGCPNGNFYTGCMLNAPNMPFKGNVHFIDLFKKYFKNLPIVLTNDANAAAVGEMIYGKAVGLHNFAMITLGTGLGSGFVVNDELIYGYDGLAGELGHTIIIINGRSCACGRKGCLERYVS
ncbi:MAG: ROK family protein, partial [Bacteroidales bacterium]